ncbi:MAG: sulfatase-like hydrolase/transferase [Pseudoramibacter sp.]
MGEDRKKDPRIAKQSENIEDLKDEDQIKEDQQALEALNQKASGKEKLAKGLKTLGLYLRYAFKKIARGADQLGEKIAGPDQYFNDHAIWLHIPLSILVVFIIELVSRHSFAGVFQFMTRHTIAFLYNCLVVYLIYSVTFLVRRRSFLRVLITGVLLLLGVINGILLLSRVSPFGFTDFTMISDLLTMKSSKYVSGAMAAAVVFCVILFLIYVVFLFFKGQKQKGKRPFWARLIAVALCIAAIPGSTVFLQKRHELSSYFGNLAQGYSDYGFLYGFGNSVFGRGMSKPWNYSEKSVKKITSNTNMGKTVWIDGKKVNVVVVLLESFLDPTEVKYLSMSKDPIPYFHSLESNYSSGYLEVPVVGAGTCNTEFEMLTGMSMQFFGPGEYPQKTILKKVQSAESYASDLKKLGIKSHVVHNNGANFYSRKNAFSKMGFDTFTSKEMLDITKKEYNPIKTWPTDDILIDSTKQAMDSTKGKDFVYTITVATHGNYPDYKVFTNPDVKVKAKGKDQALDYKWEYYVNMLYREDQWIKNYISMLKSRKEPTLVIMFGDHVPSMDLTNQEVKSGDIFKTKYITWNNFGMKKEDMNLASYNLVADMLGRLGVHGGTVMNYHQKMLQNGVQYGSMSYMRGLKMLQYDLLYGKRYAYNGKNPYPATNIKMGISDVKIDRVYTYDNRVHLFGENFTRWSRIFVNGKQVSTKYKSGQHLSLSVDDVRQGDKIQVSQMGSGDDVLRSSNKVTYSAPTVSVQ